MAFVVIVFVVIIVAVDRGHNEPTSLRRTNKLKNRLKVNKNLIPKIQFQFGAADGDCDGDSDVNFCSDRKQRHAKSKRSQRQAT